MKIAIGILTILAGAALTAAGVLTLTSRPYIRRPRRRAVRF